MEKHPGVYFTNPFGVNDHYNAENRVMFGNSPVPSASAPQMVTLIPRRSAECSSRLSTPNAVTSSGKPEVKVNGPRQILRQPLQSIVPHRMANQTPKSEDVTGVNNSFHPTDCSASGQNLTDFADKLENYKPTIPDNVVQHYMQVAGLSSSDPKVVQLIGLASQKFIADIVNDTYHFSQTQNPTKLKRTADKKPTLTLDVLAPVLEGYGIDLKKSVYFN